MVIIFVLMLAIQIHASSVDSLATKPLESSAPVIYGNQVLFYIHTDYGPYSSWERAKTISERLIELSKTAKLYPDSLRIVKSESEYNISYSDRLLLTISPADSALFGIAMEDIAQRYHTQLRNGYFPLIEQYSLRQSIIGTGKVFVFLILIVLVTRYALKLLNRLLAKVLGLMQIIRFKYRHGFQVKGVQLISSSQFDKLIGLLIGLIRTLMIIIILYAAFYLMLYVIPGTRTFARTLQGYIMSPLKSVGASLLEYIPNVFFILVILFISRYFLKTLRFVFDEIEKGHLKIPGFYTEWAVPTYQMVRILIFLFIAIIVFPYLPGSQSPAFRGISVFVGILFSLGSSSAIANMVSGIILTYMRPYKVGDIIQIGDVTGELVETSLLVIRIKTFKQVEVTIPNSVVLGGKIFDYSRYAEDKSLCYIQR